MIVTFNCDWTTPEEELEHREEENGLAGISAIIGTDWRPVCPANENIPEWLKIYG